MGSSSSSSVVVPKDSICGSLISNGWFYEKNSAWPGICNGYEIDSILCFCVSPFQEILIFSATNGAKVFVLDGVVQFDTLWEHIYHEMLCHIPLFVHPHPVSVLVFGGGDGLCLREIVKHECIERIVWVEIVQKVIELTQKYI